jgi:hypothetical protein
VDLHSQPKYPEPSEDPEEKKEKKIVYIADPRKSSYKIPTKMGVKYLKESPLFKAKKFEQALFEHLILWFTLVKEGNTDIKPTSNDLPIPFDVKQLAHQGLCAAWNKLAQDKNTVVLKTQILDKVFGKNYFRDPMVLTDRKYDFLMIKHHGDMQVNIDRMMRAGGQWCICIHPHKCC